MGIKWVGNREECRKELIVWNRLKEKQWGGKVVKLAIKKELRRSSEELEWAIVNEIKRISEEEQKGGKVAKWAIMKELKRSSEEVKLDKQQQSFREHNTTDFWHNITA